MLRKVTKKMFKKLFLNLKDKFENQLTTNEKRLAIIAFIVILIFIIDFCIILPIKNYNSELMANIEEQQKILTGIQNYILHKNENKMLYKGKASDFLKIFYDFISTNDLKLNEIKQLDNLNKDIIIRFTIEGDINKVLVFLLKIEQLEYFVSFNKVDIKYNKGNSYLFNGEIQIYHS